MTPALMILTTLSGGTAVAAAPAPEPSWGVKGETVIQTRLSQNQACYPVIRDQVLAKGGVVRHVVISRSPRFGVVMRASFSPAPHSPMREAAPDGDAWRFICWRGRDFTGATGLLYKLLSPAARDPFPSNGFGG